MNDLLNGKKKLRNNTAKTSDGKEPAQVENNTRRAINTEDLLNGKKKLKKNSSTPRKGTQNKTPKKLSLQQELQQAIQNRGKVYKVGESEEEKSGWSSSDDETQTTNDSTAAFPSGSRPMVSPDVEMHSCKQENGDICWAMWPGTVDPELGQLYRDCVDSQASLCPELQLMVSPSEAHMHTVLALTAIH